MLTLIFSFLAAIIIGFASHPKDSVGRALIYFSALILVVPLALRNYEVGTDTIAYYQIFEGLRRGEEVRYEPLFVAFNKMFHWLGLPPEALFVLFAAITLALIFRFIERHSTDYLISLSFFLALAYYFYMFNIVRQGMAIGILCYAFRYVLSREHWKFLIGIVLATGFHYSAPLFYGAYFMIRRFPVWLISGIWLFSLFSMLVINPLVEVMMMVVGQFGGEYYLSYFLVDDDEVVISFRRILLQFIFFLGLVLLYQDRRKFLLSNEELAITNITLVGIVVSNMMARLGWLSRLSDYYDIFVIIFIPILIFRLVQENNRPLVTVFLVGFCSLFYFRLLLIGSHGVAPYTTWVVGTWW